MAGPVRIAILANGTQARREFAQTGAAGTAMGSKFGALGSLLKGGVVAGAFAATAGIVSLGKASITAASDAEQSLGATETVFGRFADRVIKTSDLAADRLGLSSNAYRESANLIGSLFKNQGVQTDQLAAKTDRMIGIGADLAATFGGTTAEAVGALGSAFKGEYDPLERYGVSLKQSTVNAEALRVANVKSTSEFESLSTAQQNAAKQQATTNLLMKQSADSTGAFSREADTLAGAQQRLSAGWDNLKSDIGSAFLPVLTNATTFVTSEAIPALRDLGENLRQSQRAPNGTGDTILGTLVDSGRNFLDMLDDLRDGAAEGFEAVSDAVRPVLRENGPMLRQLAGYVGDVAGAFSDFQGGAGGQALQWLGKGIGFVFEETVAKVKLAGNAFFGFSNVVLAVAGGAVEGITDMGANVIDVFTEIAEAADAIPGVDLSDTIDSLKSARENVEGFGDDFKDTTDGIRRDLGVQAHLWNLTDAQAAQYRNVLLAMPEEVRTKVQTPGAIKSFTDVRRLARQYDLTADEVITSIRAAGVNVAYADQRRLIRQYDLTPKQVRTLFKTQGIEPSLRGLTELQRRYGLTPKQINSVVGLSGIDVSRKQIRTIFDDLDDVGKKKTDPKVTADTSSAMSDTDAFIRRLAEVKSKTITITTNYRTNGSPGGGGGGDNGRTVDPAGRGIDPALRSTRNEVERVIKRLREATKNPRDFVKALRDEIGKAVDKYNSLRNAAEDYARAVRQGYVDFAAVTSLGSGDGYSSFDEMLAVLQGRADQSADFTAAIRELRSKGLNEAAIKDLLAQGPGALGIAQTILEGDRDGIREINRLQSQIARDGAGIGKTIASDMYGAAIRAAREFEKALRKYLDPKKGGGGGNGNGNGNNRLAAEDYARDFDAARTRARRLSASDALAAQRATASTQRQVVTVRLTAEQASAVQRGREITLDLAAYKAAGERVPR